MASTSQLHKSMTLRYCFALCLLAGLSLIAYALMSAAIKTQEHGAELINLSGRQRMLSQKIALNAERLAAAATSAEQATFAARLRNDLGQFLTAHDRLQATGASRLGLTENSAAVKLFYEGDGGLSNTVRQYAQAVDAVLLAAGSSAAGVHLEAVRRINDGPTGGNGLLVQLDAVVKRYQNESEQSVGDLKRAEAAICTLTLLLLLGEALFIFRPMANNALRLFSSLTEAREVALRATDAKSSFLATITHEIRTPMIGVQGIANFLLESELAPTQRDHVATVKRMSDALIVLVNDILDFSKIESGKLTVESLPFELGSVLSDANALFEMTAVKKGVTLQVHSLGGTANWRQGDPLRISQVLSNLISNAIKFTPSGGLVEMRAEPFGTGLKFSVKDSGIGLSTSQQARLFRRFAQADESTARNYGGTGLGLAISKQIVELMGGEIGVVSIEGEGATFWFTLPLAIEVSAPATAQPRTQPIAGQWLGKQVLLAEDNPINQKIAQAVLAYFGFEVTTVSNGEEAVAAFAARSYALVLMDCEMPLVDGYTAARRIRDSGATLVPIVALSAHSADHIKRQCLEAGMDRFMSKPFTKYDVDRVISPLLADGAPILRQAG